RTPNWLRPRSPSTTGRPTCSAASTPRRCAGPPDTVHDGPSAPRAPGGSVMDSTDIDRVAPTLRPDEGAVMKQRWAELLFLHWAVDATALRARLPAGVELDTFEG